MSSAPASSRPRPSFREPPRRRWVIGAAVCLLALTGGGLAAAAAYGANDTPAAESSRPATALIDRGPLLGTRTASGVLDYVAARDLIASVAGILTAAPPAGAQVGNGQTLFTVDNVGVYLFRGDLPAWRAFEQTMTDGPDVRQLEQSLNDLGMFDREPDDVFDWSTRAAIQRWQKATGQSPTGRIELGRVVFAPTDLRIAEVKAALGDAVGGVPVLRVSGLTKDITSQLKLADQQIAQLGQKVTIHLPAGVATTGTVTTVGQPTEKEDGGKDAVVIPVTVALDDPAVVDDIQRASVTIDFPSERRDDVLSVPLESLLVLPDGSFGVEVMGSDGTTARVPVIVGLFAGGRVEISGDDVEAGMNVVVPEL